MNIMFCCMFLGLFILIMAGIVYLQIRLSKKEDKWPGLFVPIIMFIISLIGSVGLVPFNRGSIVTLALSILAPFIMLNIPTMILLAIYFCSRSGMKRNKQIEKMNIQDLM